MTDPTPRPYPRPSFEHLRRALAEQAPARIAQDAIHLEELTTRPQLEGLAHRLERAHAEAMLIPPLSTQDGMRMASFAEDIRRAADVVKAAALHGYPRPALEALGRAGEGIPGARASDPGTSHAAAASVPLVKRGNMLGRLLVGFRVYDREVATRIASNGRTEGHPRYRNEDPTLTSEELAHRLNLEHTEYAKRCSDLLALGYIRVAQDDDGHDRTRAGRSGRQRLVFELTDDGRRVADALRFDH